MITEFQKQYINKNFNMKHLSLKQNLDLNIYINSYIKKSQDGRVCIIKWKDYNNASMKIIADSHKRARGEVLRLLKEDLKNGGSYSSDNFNPNYIKYLNEKIKNILGTI